MVAPIIQERINYKVIKVLSLTMNIWERVFYRRFRKKTRVRVEQFSHVQQVDNPCHICRHAVDGENL